MSKGKLITILVIVGLIGFLLRPPVTGGKLTSWFGIRPGGLDGNFHTGSDIGHAVGTPVRSVAGGKVRSTGFHDNAGNFVNVSHMGIAETRYYHLDAILATTGQSVNHKTVIGTVGNTGLSTGPHLHFEVRFFGIPLPAYLLTFPGRIFDMFNVPSLGSAGSPSTTTPAPAPAPAE